MTFDEFPMLSHATCSKRNCVVTSYPYPFWTFSLGNLRTQDMFNMFQTEVIKKSSPQMGSPRFVY